MRRSLPAMTDLSTGRPESLGSCPHLSQGQRAAPTPGPVQLPPPAPRRFLTFLGWGRVGGWRGLHSDRGLIKVGLSLSSRTVADWRTDLSPVLYDSTLPAVRADSLGRVPSPAGPLSQ